MSYLVLEPTLFQVFIKKHTIPILILNFPKLLNNFFEQKKNEMGKEKTLKEKSTKKVPEKTLKEKRAAKEIKRNDKKNNSSI